MKRSDQHHTKLMLSGIVLSAAVSFFYFQQRSLKDKHISWSDLLADRTNFKKRAKQQLQVMGNAVQKLCNFDKNKLSNKQASALEILPVTTAASETVTEPEVSAPHSTAGTTSNCQVLVNYVDEDNNLIAQSEILRGKEGVSYASIFKSVKGYLLKKRTDNAKGRFKAEAQVVKYIYIKDSAYQAPTQNTK
ncbi:MucBP domain-containing protein [Lactobacillus sp. ESL0230]|uniref:MucBP domain-containing protein n=1 Tax=Lactobacillus sp. ESL0230 TaxID=2069353 RepID=UPI0011C37E80|nr:MucBP domain-containing protein [Lactobacillus sp. ESL0230]